MFSSVSPSVYIAYHQLQAFISCPTAGFIARGKSYNTTIGYAPEDLSASMSARAHHEACAFFEMNYTKLADYPSWSRTDFILSLPGDLSSVDPAWSTCVPANYGAFDPPSTLPNATALTDPTAKSPSSTTPAPGSHVGPAYGPATTTSVAASSGSGIFQSVQKSAEPRRTNSQILNAAKPGDPVTLPDGIPFSASGSSDEVTIESDIIHVIEVPAATASKITAQLTSFASYDIIPSMNTTATPAQGTLVSSPSGGANFSVIPGVNASRYPTSHVAGTNGSTPKVYTGGTEGSSIGFLGSVRVMLAFSSITATALWSL